MVNFIICDDNPDIRNKVSTAIDRIMMANRLAYHIFPFQDYNEEFLNQIQIIEGHRIFVLDIETPSRSGIDIARIIRTKDKESSIIFLTSHDELGYTLLRSKINFLTFISKYDDYEENLRDAITESLKYVGVKRTLDFIDHGVEFSIPVSNILYITKDSVERKTVIRTDHNEYRVYTSLHDLQQELSSKFKQTHRSCLINSERVESINYHKKAIIFDNGEQIDLLSESYKRKASK